MILKIIILSNSEDSAASSTEGAGERKGFTSHPPSRYAASAVADGYDVIKW